MMYNMSADLTSNVIILSALVDASNFCNIMADPYNPYSSYPTPTPGGISYYPPDDQSHSSTYGYQQQPYIHQEPYQEPYQPTQDPYPVHAPQQSQYNLAPDPYGAPLERSYTPAGQPDYQGPITPAGYQPAQAKTPENADY